MIVGYGFYDDHINKMLAQALRDESERTLFVVGQCKTNKDVERKRREVAKKLDLKPDRVAAFQGSAKSFLEQANLAQILSEKIPKAEDTPF